MESVVLVDIDGVLSYGHLPLFMALCNDILQLDIHPDVLADIRSRSAFEALPELVDHRERVGRDKYERQLELVRWHPFHIQRCNVIPQAREGVRYLADRSTVQYCTARSMEDEKWNSKIQTLTCEWLHAHAFPNPELVMFCDSVLAKLSTIAKLLKIAPLYVYLVDDSLDLLLDAYEELPTTDQQLLQQYLTLIAFSWRKDEYENDAPLSIMPLKDWSQVEKEFNNYAFGQKRMHRVQVRSSVSL